jgi:hypothetical protein
MTGAEAGAAAGAEIGTEFVAGSSARATLGYGTRRAILRRLVATRVATL